jgi:hypothetical protein
VSPVTDYEDRRREHDSPLHDRCSALHAAALTLKGGHTYSFRVEVIDGELVAGCDQVAHGGHPHGAEADLGYAHRRRRDALERAVVWREQACRCRRR